MLLVMLLIQSCFVLLCHASSDTICSKDKNHYAFGHAFGQVILCLAMLLLTQSAPKIIILSSITHSPRFGEKREIYYSSVTIHCYYSLSLFTYYYSLRIFAYLRGLPLIFEASFECAQFRTSSLERVFTCEPFSQRSPYLLQLPTFSTKLVTPKPCNYFQLVITTTVSVQFYFQ